MISKHHLRSFSCEKQKSVSHLFEAHGDVWRVQQRFTVKEAGVAQVSVTFWVLPRAGLQVFPTAQGQCQLHLKATPSHNHQTPDRATIRQVPLLSQYQFPRSSPKVSYCTIIASSSQSQRSSLI